MRVTFRYAGLAAGACAVLAVGMSGCGSQARVSAASSPPASTSGSTSASRTGAATGQSGATAGRSRTSQATAPSVRRHVQTTLRPAASLTPPPVGPGSRTATSAANGATVLSRVTLACRAAPPLAAPAGAVTDGSTATGGRELAQQLLPRVAALQHLLATAPSGSAAGPTLAARLAGLRDALGELEATLQHAFAGGGPSSAASIHRAAVNVTASAQQAGLPDCGLAGA